MGAGCRIMNTMLQPFAALAWLLLAGIISGILSTVAAAESSGPRVKKNEAAATTELGGSGTRPLSPHGAGGAGGTATDPHFSIYFDLLLANQPGKAEFSFLNFHPLLFFEILPKPEIQFTFEVRPDPRYFELDYQASERVQIRAGKMWIPFDDSNPHNQYGGRTGTSRMRLGTDYFLPDIWTDLGVGAKFQVSDTGSLSSEAHVYVVNGFPESTGSGGTESIPNFLDQSVTATDNNSDKAVGGRLHFLFDRAVGLGFSVYTGRWNNEVKGADVPARLNMAGADAQLRIKNSVFRVGVIGQWADLGNQKTLRRHGEYFEVSERFLDVWRVVIRAGNLDTDDRSTDVNDVLVVGAGIIYKPGVLQVSLDHQIDIKTVSAKAGYTFTAVRLAVQM